VQYLPERASIKVKDGATIQPGTVLAETPRETGGVTDITGGLPRVTELFEARKPKDPAVIAEIDGEVELLKERKRGKRIVIVRSPDGTEVEHVIPTGRQMLAHTGDLVRAGDAIARGPLVPHDILRVSGTEAVQQYLVHEIQNVYRAQRVEIDDKHIEIVVSQMLRKVKIEDVGDTNLLPGVLIDKLEFRRTNEALQQCVRITDAGETDFQAGDIVPKETLEETNSAVEADGQTPASVTTPKPAIGSTQLLGITKAAVQSESFISAASFQETTKVLTEAALAGKVDYLVGLKENVILGHLVPAGTGFKAHQEAEVRIRPEALEALAEKGPGFARYPRDEAPAAPAPASTAGGGTPLDRVAPEDEAVE
jgi:DNA-directed RNA polymerase subunit beta'